MVLHRDDCSGIRLHPVQHVQHFAPLSNRPTGRSLIGIVLVGCTTVLVRTATGHELRISSALQLEKHGCSKRHPFSCAVNFVSTYTIAKFFMNNSTNRLVALIALAIAAACFNTALAQDTDLPDGVSNSQNPADVSLTPAESLKLITVPCLLYTSDAADE